MRSVAVWHRSEAATILLSALIALIIAVLAAIGFRVTTEVDWPTMILVGLAVWFFVLTVHITPLRLLYETRIERDQLKGAASPKLKVLYGKNGIFYKENYEDHYLTREIVIGIQNDSSQAMDGVEVILANVVSKDKRERRDISKPMTGLTNAQTRNTLNPLAIEYFSLASVKLLSVGRDEYTDILFGPIAGGALCTVPRGNYVVKFRVSAKNSPDQACYFSVGLTANKGRLLFEPISMPTTGEIEANVTREVSQP